MPQMCSMRRLVLALATFAVISLGSASVRADPITISTGNPGNAGTDNVLFNDPSLSHDGLLVQGNFNGTGSGFIVDFTSTSGSRLLEGSGGQATLTGGVGNELFTNFTFGLENNATFTAAIFNIDVMNGLPPPTTVDITVNYILAGSQQVTQTFSVDPNGQNFFNVQAAMGAVITSITVQATGNTTFVDVNQFRLGGFAPAEIPEPASMLLLGTGLAGVAMAVRRRLNK
jgi:hypothetical protein